MPPLSILAVDPGARETGLVVVSNDTLLAHDVVVAGDKLDPRHPVDLDYLKLVRARIETLLGAAGVGHALDVVAVEDVGAPEPHLGMTNAAGIVAVGALIGYLASWADDLTDPVPFLKIAPDGYGGSMLRTYPGELVGPLETKGKGILRHARSAYDIALAARYYANLDARSRLT